MCGGGGLPASLVPQLGEPVYQGGFSKLKRKSFVGWVKFCKKMLENSSSLLLCDTIKNSDFV